MMGLAKMIVEYADGLIYLPWEAYRQPHADAMKLGRECVGCMSDPERKEFAIWMLAR